MKIRKQIKYSHQRKLCSVVRVRTIRNSISMRISKIFRMRSKNQLKVMCVLFCADIGGILQLVFDEEGNLEFRTACNEDDLLYDDIGSGLKIKELRQKNEDLLRGLELYYKVIFDKLEE